MSKKRANEGGEVSFQQEVWMIPTDLTNVDTRQCTAFGKQTWQSTKNTFDRRQREARIALMSTVDIDISVSRRHADG